MYDMLFDSWLKEKQNAELQKLPEDFYPNLAEYIARIRREGRMLDPKSAKAKLVSKELENGKRLVKEIAMLRFKKIVSHVASVKPTEKETLILKEEKILLGVKPSFENFRSFLESALRGKISKIEEEPQKPKRVLLRFMKEIPAIIGADLNTYGPFLVEDVATLPAENAKILVKQGVANEIEAR